MRIAYVCADPGVPVFGCKGCSIHVQEVMRSLVKQGHQVELFAVRWDGDPPEDLAAIPCHKLPKLPRYGRDITKEQHQKLRELSSISLNLDLRLALENAGQFDSVYERYSLWNFTAMDYARQQRIPGVLEVNSPLIAEQVTHRGLIHQDAAEKVAQLVFRSADVLVAVSDGVAADLKRYPQTQGKVQVIPNGVNTQRFPVQQPPTLPSSDFTIGFVGTLKPWHGLSILVDAFARLHHAVPQVRLLIVGDGPERTAIEASLFDRGIHESVHFTGQVSATEIPGLLASMDVAVAPYPDSANFYFSPMKVYEYMAAGLPVVASRVGQLQTLIQNEVNGLLYEPGNSQSLADQLAHLRKHPELRQQLGHNARLTMQRSHTWEQVTQQITHLMQHPIATLEVNA
jgi:glycosyltransferase involved in cell wall biosynthesis